MLDCRVLVDLQDHRVLPGHQERKEYLEIQVSLVHQVQMDLPDLPEIRVLLVIRDPMEVQDCQELVVLQEFQDLKDQQETQDRLDQSVQLDPAETKVQ
jgi:hypothetical protein